MGPIELKNYQAPINNKAVSRKENKVKTLAATQEINCLMTNASKVDLFGTAGLWSGVGKRPVTALLVDCIYFIYLSLFLPDFYIGRLSAPLGTFPPVSSLSKHTSPSHSSIHAGRAASGERADDIRGALLVPAGRRVI